jgi:uncharacterized membrane protein (TIGR02234 family)
MVAARRPGRLVPAAAVAAFVLAAGLLWWSSRLTWLTVDFGTPLRGRVRVSADGAQAEPALLPFAVLALAAVAAVLGTAGPLRRLVGVLLVAAGGLVAVRAAAVLLDPHAATQPPAPTGGVVHAVTGTAGGPVPALAGAALLLAGGLLVALRGGRIPALGARYRARPGPPGDRPGAGAASVVRQPVREPAEAGAHSADDRSRRLWDELDAGHDPT